MLNASGKGEKGNNKSAHRGKASDVNTVDNELILVVHRTYRRYVNVYLKRCELEVGDVRQSDVSAGPKRCEPSGLKWAISGLHTSLSKQSIHFATHQ